VERIGFGLASPGGRDALTDAVGGPGEIQDAPPRIEHAEVVDADGERRPREVRFLAELSRDLAAL
jgi:hypothetical protein